jgi:hypothetical protein
MVENFDVNGLLLSTTSTTTVVVTETQLLVYVVACADYALLNNDFKGGTNLYTVDLVTGVSTVRPLTIDSTLDGVLFHQNGYGAAWQDFNGNFIIVTIQEVYFV